MRLRAGVAIDLGTVNTLVYVAGRGLVIDEPSAIAVDKTAGGVTAVGGAADALAGEDPRGVDVIHPPRDGGGADPGPAGALLPAVPRPAGPRPGLPPAP